MSETLQKNQIKNINLQKKEDIMVIQRIQTLYLLIALVLMTAFAFLTSFSFDVDGGEYLVGTLATGVEGKTSIHLLLLCLNALVVVLTLIAIFSYKNLKLQKRLCSISILLLIALLISIGVMIIGATGEQNLSIDISNVLPVASLLLLFLAYRGIARDQRILIDSARIR